METGQTTTIINFITILNDAHKQEEEMGIQSLSS